MHWTLALGPELGIKLRRSCSARMLRKLRVLILSRSTKGPVLRPFYGGNGELEGVKMNEMSGWVRQRHVTHQMDDTFMPFLPTQLNHQCIIQPSDTSPVVEDILNSANSVTRTSD